MVVKTSDLQIRSSVGQIGTGEDGSNSFLERFRRETLLDDLIAGKGRLGGPDQSCETRSSLRATESGQALLDPSKE